MTITNNDTTGRRSHCRGCGAALEEALMLKGMRRIVGISDKGHPIHGVTEGVPMWRTLDRGHGAAVCPQAPEGSRYHVPGPMRVQQSRRAGWRKPDGAVSVARGTRWGNPYAVEKVKGGRFVVSHGDAVVGARLTREEAHKVAVKRYADDLHAGVLDVTVDEVRELLHDHDLMCWCPQGLACHADTLLAIANPR